MYPDTGPVEGAESEDEEDESESASGGSLTCARPSDGVARRAKVSARADRWPLPIALTTDNQGICLTEPVANY